MDLVEAFWKIADRSPDRPAIFHNGQAIDYRRLEAAVREVARRLGPDPGTVGVLATHHPDTVAGLFGIWAAGGTYCPVDPAFPPVRRQFMLQAAGCRSVLTAGGEVIVVAQEGPAESPGAESRGAAYCLFTSGSTGEPRPVLTAGQAVDTTVAALRELFDLEPADRVLQFASLNWDTSFEEILPTLTSGAALVLHDAAHSGSFPRFLRMVDSEQVTVLNLPTAFWHELVNYLTEERRALPDPVRLVVIGGEPVSPARLADWAALATGGIRLVNTYGCTETTLITHAVDLCGPLASPDVPARAPLGRALPHVVEHLGDEGELLVGGPSVALGYRGLPAATAARFVTVGGRRFFRTGDRVSRRPDGLLQHEGRLDDQVKIRGIRVDPAEVEAEIAGHPGVGAVAVTGLAVADHTVLAAFVVARPQADPDTLGAEITDYLRGRVPAHLVPSRVSIVAELVHTASGKVDRRRIREAVQ